MSTLKIRENSSSPWQSIPTGGVGVPAGGTTNQFLTKSSNVDYATQWSTVTPATIGAMAEWDLLWENASPTSSFDEQTLNISLTNYDLVWCVHYNGSALDEIKSGLYRKGEKGLMTSEYLSGGTANYFRYITPSDSGVAFGKGTLAGSGYSGNYVRPLAIYGIKGVHRSL